MIGPNCLCLVSWVIHSPVGPQRRLRAEVRATPRWGPRQLTSYHSAPQNGVCIPSKLHQSNSPSFTQGNTTFHMSLGPTSADVQVRAMEEGPGAPSWSGMKNTWVWWICSSHASVSMCACMCDTERSSEIRVEARNKIGLITRTLVRDNTVTEN